MSALNDEFINVFNWSDIHNKELKIKVTVCNDGIVVMGYDKRTGITYMLHQEAWPQKEDIVQ